MSEDVKGLKLEIVHPSVELITPVDEIERMERRIELIGRTSYKSEDKITDESAGAFIRKLIKRGHESVLEHCGITVRHIGSRSFSHQHVRHRISAFCIDGDAITELTTKGGARRRRTIRELYGMKQTSHGRGRLKLVKLNCMDEATGEIVQNRVKDVVFNGKKLCVEITVDGGYRIKATKDHRFFTKNGWMPLEEAIEKGEAIAANGALAPSSDWCRREYVEKGRSRKDIAGDLGLSVAWVCKWFTAWGIKRGPLKVPSKGWIQKEYFDKNRPRRELAEELGVSESWLGNQLSRMGLQKPHSSRPNRMPGHGNPDMHGRNGRGRISRRMRGEGNHRWRGGVTSRRQGICHQITSELRRGVYERDGFTCRLCEEVGGKLTLHHIVPVWQNESLALEPGNMVTLCQECHYKVNGHEEEYQALFDALEPVRMQPRRAEAQLHKVVVFRRITSCRDAGELDTYDVVMAEPHHNFIANGLVVHNCQESQRYCNYGKVDSLKVILPPSIGALAHGAVIDFGGAGYEISGMGEVDVDSGLEAWLFTVAAAYRDYLEMLANDVRPEDARSVLPNATKTEIITTFNIRQWRHYFDMRCDSHAQWEIRGMALTTLRGFYQMMPNLFGDKARKFDIIETRDEKGDE